MNRKNSDMKLILIDVDDTLYPKGTGPFPHVNKRIDDYVMARCNVGFAEAKELRRGYISSYGSTLGGLMKHYGVDPDHYLRAVHDVPVEDLLRQDLRLKKTLSGIENEMVVFSNGSVDYVKRVLKALGISDLFRDLFTIEFMDFIPKPKAYPYRKAIELYGRRPEECVLVDDRMPNICTAIDMGMDTVMVGSDSPVPGARIIPDIYAIPQAVY
jgi:putative hydrolase of the HAD superfamily